MRREAGSEPGGEDRLVRSGAPERDLAGFASAVESYEYSKMAMNSLAVESTAGTSLGHAPLFNPAGVTGEAAMRLLRDRVPRHAIARHAGPCCSMTARPAACWRSAVIWNNAIRVRGVEVSQER